jgi:FKBP-type peptidyl-prolyl cis-trans isomerase
MKKIILLGLLPAMLGMGQLIAQTKLKMNEEVTTPSGLKVKLLNKVDDNAPKAVAGDTVVVHYTGTFTDGKKFDSSFDRNEPIKFALGKGMVIKGWEEGLLLLRKGEKAILTIPSELGYGSMQRGPIPANSTLIFEVELVDIHAGPKFDFYNTDGKKVITLPSGLQYVVVEEGSGESPKKGQKVTVHYTGFFMDKQVFDSSVPRKQPFQFSLGTGQVIAGWDEGVALMKKGAKYRLILPYNLAYGERGSGPIPPKATLLFDVELIDFN